MGKTKYNHIINLVQSNKLNLQSFSKHNVNSFNADGRGITSISYNRFDRPECIEMENGACIFYAYDATGQKIAKMYRNGYTTDTRHYIGQGELTVSNSNTPSFSRVNFDWGYINNRNIPQLYIKDYQGNVRAVVDTLGKAVQTTDYYPYGLPMATSTGADVNRYKYSGKELETRLGLNYHDFEARMLFNDHTLFGRPDDLAGKYPHLNPYLYCAANPLRYIDPTGMRVELSGTGIHSFTRQLQVISGNSIHLYMLGNDLLYLNIGNNHSKEAQSIIEAIDNPTINIRINTTDDWKTQTLTGEVLSFIGGAFIGNIVNNSSGINTVTAYQTVNSDVLAKIGNKTNNIGTEALHELTEAYNGATQGQQSGVSSKENPNAYQNAHNAAYPQKAIIKQTLFCNNGKHYNDYASIPPGVHVISIKWYVIDSEGNDYLIQSAP